MNLNRKIRLITVTVDNTASSVSGRPQETEIGFNVWARVENVSVQVTDGQVPVYERGIRCTVRAEDDTRQLFIGRDKIEYEGVKFLINDVEIRPENDYVVLRGVREALNA